MEPLCIAQTPVNRDFCREIYWTLYFSRKGGKLRLVISSLATAVGIFIGLPEVIELFFMPRLVLAEIGWANIVFWPTILAFLIYHGFRLIFAPRLYARAQQKRLKNLAGDKPVFSEILFYENEFTVSSATSGTKFTSPYENIKSVEETAHYYIAFTKRGESIPFLKTGFSVGSAEQAIYLMKRRSFSQ